MGRQNNPEAPFLRKLREARRFSRRVLAERAGVSAEAIQSLENGNPGRERTIASLAGALDFLPGDLTGKSGMPPEQMEAYLDLLLTEKKTIAPGDPLYDNNMMATMTDAELAQFVRKNPAARHRVAALMAHQERLSAAIEQASREHEEERESLDAENQQDAG